MLKLLRRRRKRGAAASTEDVPLALLDARLRGMKYFIASSEEGISTAFSFVGVVSRSLSTFMGLSS
jgi:hypothetical protein